MHLPARTPGSDELSQNLAEFSITLTNFRIPKRSNEVTNLGTTPSPRNTGSAGSDVEKVIVDCQKHKQEPVCWLLDAIHTWARHARDVGKGGKEGEGLVPAGKLAQAPSLRSALYLFRTLLERIVNAPLEPVLAVARVLATGAANDSTRYWMPDHVVKMWSAVFRTSRSIFENCDTNMLIEATLLNEVLPYYALKQRRQDLGFEGPDLEVKKRKDILEWSQAYIKSDIMQVGDSGSKFLVRSKSDPSRVYEVDIDTYTCTCIDYPLICFCKHICAVQRLFDEPGNPPDGARASPKVPSLTLSLPPQDRLESNVPQDFSGLKPNVCTVIAEKLERLAARLRRPCKNDSEIPALGDLELALDSMLLVTETGAVLPAAQHFAPVVKETARSTMMPAVKTRCPRVGDPAYGAGVRSGGKAKKEHQKKSKVNEVPLTVPPASTSAPPAPIPVPPAPILAPTPHQPFPPPAYPFTYYHPVPYIYPTAS
ncbi:hypothetical protein MVEN_00110600 [Mycena venus]|uniref:SWIM-type domain-containing protein n=1 Tax=Mycena venus TaxID=2733690 RepID=A0A8H7DEI1_9AGAR|nr:hypothetical protein MVEN_00110600 [Mycena venus]